MYNSAIVVEEGVIFSVRWRSAGWDDPQRVASFFEERNVFMTCSCFEALFLVNQKRSNTYSNHLDDYLLAFLRGNSPRTTKFQIGDSYTLPRSKTFGLCRWVSSSLFQEKHFDDDGSWTQTFGFGISIYMQSIKSNIIFL